MFAVAVSLLLGVVTLSFLYLQRKKIAKKNEFIAGQKIESLLDEQEIKTYNAMLEGQEEERMRIATDLHDRLGSMLSTIKLLFSSLDEKIDANQKESIKQYETATNLIDDAVVEVRRISHNLGSGMVANFGLVKSIEELCDSVNQSGKIETKVLVYGYKAKVPLRIEVEIYRIVQEIVNNCIKHANASTLTVQLNQIEDILNITVEDNGVGFSYEDKMDDSGMGLANIKRRAEKFGGSLHIDSGKGRGTTSIIEIPLT